MAWEEREGSGSMFRNDKKGNVKAPDFRGTIMLDGKLFEVSAWTRNDKNGNKYLSLAGKTKQERSAPSQSYGATPKEPHRPPAPLVDMDEDSIPW